MSKKIRAVFYEARWFDGHAIDTAIYLWTGLFNRYRSKDSHCSLWTPDEGGQFSSRVHSNMVRGTMGEGEEDWHETAYWGTCYTSTMRGENNGVVSRPAYKVFKNPERWCYYEIEISDEEYNSLIGRMVLDIGDNKGYGKRTILKFFNPIEKFRFINRKEPICSGRVKAWLRGCAKFFYAWKPTLDSPMRLSGRLEKMGFERKRLTSN